QHHERMDGSGYPEGLKNGQISKLARVAAVADSYEAMVSPRVYRDRKSSYEAMQIIIQDAGQKYWEKAARTFYQSMAIYPIGSVVELNSGEVGVVHQATGAPMRPKIKIIVDEDGNNPSHAPIVNMVQNQEYFIVDVLDEVDV
ncbi:MAG: HD-GYP domain-containing protein, partial [bacterium]